MARGKKGTGPYGIKDKEGDGGVVVLQGQAEDVIGMPPTSRQESPGESNGRGNWDEEELPMDSRTEEAAEDDGLPSDAQHILESFRVLKEERNRLVEELADSRQELAMAMMGWQSAEMDRDRALDGEERSGKLLGKVFIEATEHFLNQVVARHPELERFFTARIIRSYLGTMVHGGGEGEAEEL